MKYVELVGQVKRVQSLLLLRDEEESGSEDPLFPLSRWEDLRTCFSFRRSFLRCFFSLCL